jgi:predicted GNAT superfamily acetyltransferase
MKEQTFLFLENASDVPLTDDLKAVQKIEVRALEGIVDFQRAEHVQQETWGFSDRDVVPASIFSVALNFGGQALGAFDGERMVGFALSFGAFDGDHAHLHSHMVGVVPEYQNYGLGRRIKLAQRENALRRGIDRIMWTFDPLQLRNAYFNLSRLGGVGVRYIPNLYGMTSSPLHGGIPTDRLLIEWNLSSARVLSALENDPCKPGADAVSIRAVSQDLPMAQKLAGQTILRERILSLMSDGYSVTGFANDGNAAHYILEKC